MVSDFLARSLRVNFWTVVAVARFAPRSAIPTNATVAIQCARFIACSPTVNRCAFQERGSLRQRVWRHQRGKTGNGRFSSLSPPFDATRAANRTQESLAAWGWTEILV